MNIKIFDDFLSIDEKKEIYIFCKSQAYKRGEYDRPDCPPTGLVSDFLDEKIVQKLIKPIENQKIQILRTYINLFLPNEKPFYHVDNDIPNHKTIIYYANNENINYTDEGGETFFDDGPFRRGVSFVPGRMIYFDSYLLHKATSFRNLDRYTIAIKLKIDDSK